MRVKFLGSLVYSKTTNITLAIMISEPFLRFSFSNINIAISIPDFVFNIIRIMFLIIVFNGITPNFARWIMVRCKKYNLSINSSVTHRTLRLSQFYVICFTVFKVQFVVPVMVVITTNATLKTKILLYLAFSILSNFDGIINSIIFFYMNGERRSYLKTITLDKLNSALPRKHIKSKNL